MGKGILLGNGLNIRIGINGMKLFEIQKRFKDNIMRFSVVFDALFHVKVFPQEIDLLIKDTEVFGIETLAGVLYQYIKKSTTERITENLEIRLQDIVTYLALTSIFFMEHGTISKSYDIEKMIDVSNYEKVFSLNYYEFWDSKRITHYLHGYFDIDSIPSDEKVILASEQRMYLPEYKQAIDVVAKNNNVQVISLHDIVFAPDTIEKSKLVCVQGLYPSDDLFPAEDLFILRKKELYRELNSVDQLDIFGMSPYGDQSLIDELNKKDFVRVYVYEKSTNKETQDWEKLLTCSHEIIDSSSI